MHNFTINSRKNSVYGVVYDQNFSKFQLLIPPSNREMQTRIEIYAKSTENPDTLEFYFEEQIDVDNKCIEFEKEYFRFKNKPDKLVTEIEYYHEKDNKFKPRPSILLTIGTKVEKIEHDDYCFIFKDEGEWTISKTIHNNEWKETEIKGIKYYMATINKYKANDLDYDWPGKVVNGQYQIPIGRSAPLTKGKPLYIYITKDENLDKTIEFSMSKTVFKNEKVNISKNHFHLQDKNYRFDTGLAGTIQTNFIENQPSILLPAIIK
ncbi:MAG: hypothetical protein OMM_05959 [Candidatus Magnetoglobus multicellularis str. Araruama]|uniref:Uncharacterized protein n=1 Tax=Candidatus Magnetoglobus multicellularis str. Araruama TaxID=890399 RepID=A0A1V1NSX7_9BACT|nr:MAG: hypothetical protein OMM_05959 [Candidatus Magnetoglobus multicellularis str. Araruama]